MLGAAGATLISRELRLYRIDRTAAAEVLPGLDRCSAVRFVSPDRPVGTMAVTDFADPLVANEWWRAAIGVGDLTPPGPGKPVTIVDSGVSLSHPEFVGWSGLVALNVQQPEPIGGIHGTAVTSLIGAPANGVGIVGIYPLASLNSWDAALGEGTRLTTSEIVAGFSQRPLAARV